MRNTFAKGIIFVLGISSFACASEGLPREQQTHTRDLSNFVREAKFQGSDLFLTTIDDERFLVDVKDVSVVVSNHGATFVKANLRRVRANRATVEVETQEQAAEWNRRLTEVWDKFYKPRDVLPEKQ